MRHHPLLTFARCPTDFRRPPEVTTVRHFLATPLAPGTSCRPTLYTPRSSLRINTPGRPRLQRILFADLFFSASKFSTTMSCAETCRQEADKQTGKQIDSVQASQHSGAAQADTPATPEGLKLLGTQVAGHQFGSEGRKLGMLDRADGTVLKSIQEPPRGPREVNFYKDVFAKDCTDPVALELRHFLPCFHGTEHTDGVDFLVLRNVTSGFSKPNVLDLKMGRITYDPLATPKKRQHEMSKYPPLHKLGFQMIGMMTHSPDTGLPEKMERTECRSITETTMLRKGLGRFFGLHYGGLRKDVVQALLVRLKRLEKWFLKQTQFAFYSSSLLIVYDSVRQSSNHQADISQASAASTTTSKHATAEDGKLSHLKDSVCNGVDGVHFKRRKLDYSASAHSQPGSQGSSRLVSEKSKEKSPELKTSESKAKNPEVQISNDFLLNASKLQSDLHAVASSESDLVASHTIDQKEPTREKLPVGGASSKLCTSTAHESTANSGNDSAQTSSAEAPLVEVRMIDFAHVFPGEGRVDENYLFGLQRLISHLEQLLDV